MKSLVAILWTIPIILATSGQARAADPSTLDVAGGYAYSYITNGEGTSYPAGWFASVGGHLTPVFAIVGEGGAAYRTESINFSNAGFTVTGTLHLKLYTFMGGPKFTSRSRSAKVFGQFLIGGATLSSSGTATGDGITMSSGGSRTYFALAPGGGVDVKTSEHFGVRVFATFQLLNTEAQFGEWGKVFQTGVGLLWTPK